MGSVRTLDTATVAMSTVDIVNLWLISNEIPVAYYIANSHKNMDIFIVLNIFVVVNISDARRQIEATDDSQQKSDLKIEVLHCFFIISL